MKNRFCDSHIFLVSKILNVFHFEKLEILSIVEEFNLLSGNALHLYMSKFVIGKKFLFLYLTGGAGGKGTWGVPGDELFADTACRDTNDPNYDSDTQVLSF